MPEARTSSDTTFTAVPSGQDPGQRADVLLSGEAQLQPMETESRGHGYFPCWALELSFSPHIFFQDLRFLFVQRTFPDSPLLVSGSAIGVEA